jgi:hypothetical protein
VVYDGVPSDSGFVPQELAYSLDERVDFLLACVQMTRDTNGPVAVAIDYGNLDTVPLPELSLQLGGIPWRQRNACHASVPLRIVRSGRLQAGQLDKALACITR